MRRVFGVIAILITAYADLFAADEIHWAYRPVIRPDVPQSVRASHDENAIDAFVRRKLESHGLSFRHQATRAILLRRVSLDLIGLPPTIAQLDAFLRDDRPGAYERAVDRYLASPHYGEHWARRWLDLARYADTNGFNIDVTRTVWPYRDWVIRTLNENMPFDQFTVEQLAGDMLPNPTRDQRVATGFHRNTMINQEGGVDPEEDRVKAIVDRTSTTATVWLGATLACAQCHDHFNDPFPQRDFFRLYAFFNNSVDRGGGEPKTSLAPVMSLPSAEQNRRLQEIDAALAALSSDDAQKSDLQSARKAVVAAIPTTLVMGERKEPRPTRIHIRGDFQDVGEEVRPGVPEALPPMKVAGRRPTRLDLATWLVSSSNPLTARVTVNRYWQRLFGTGIVSTLDDFGTRGAEPSHPQLLDWLAAEFVESDWNVKHIHRLMVTSRTYRQSSRRRGPGGAGPPTLLAYSPRFRLEAEAVRDVCLAVGGLLDERIGGPSVYPIQPMGFWLEFGTTGFGMEDWPTSAGASRRRRGLYTFWRRTSVYPSFAILDAPTREHCSVQRPRTNTPLQALTTLNDPAFVEAAHGLALRVLTSDLESNEAKLTYAFRLCVARSPTEMEVGRLLRLLGEQRANFRADPEAAEQFTEAFARVGVSVEASDLAAWSVVASVLLNLDETLTRG